MNQHQNSQKGRATPAAKSRDTAEHQQGSEGTNNIEPLFFYMPDTANGEFCQWFPSTFTVSKAEISSLVGHEIKYSHDDENNDDNSLITFNCAEQFMMFCKAARFNDLATQSLVLATTSPKEQKRLGKLVTGFVPESWDEGRRL